MKATENIGARRLHTIMESVLEEISFEAPGLKKRTSRSTPTTFASSSPTSSRTRICRDTFCKKGGWTENCGGRVARRPHNPTHTPIKGGYAPVGCARGRLCPRTVSCWFQSCFAATTIRGDTCRNDNRSPFVTFTTHVRWPLPDVARRSGSREPALIQQEKMYTARQPWSCPTIFI